MTRNNSKTHIMVHKIDLRGENIHVHNLSSTQIINRELFFFFFLVRNSNTKLQRENKNILVNRISNRKKRVRSGSLTSILRHASSLLLYYPAIRRTLQDVTDLFFSNNYRNNNARLQDAVFLVYNKTGGFYL